MKQRDTLKINDKGHLEIGGCDAADLAREYGTPLYVMDEAYIRKVCRAYRAELSAYPRARICYASKAFSCKAIYRIMKEEPQDDGSIVIEIRKQYNNASCGTYLD